MAQVVVLTGCSAGGIGSALCEEFHKKGCIVYATARDVRKMESLSPSIHRLSLDVTSDADVDKVVRSVLDKEGRIDILVNNAGMMAAGPLIDHTTEFLHQAFDTNTFSILRVSKAVIPSMASRHSGLIVNIGSVVGNIPTPWNGVYCATKAATHSISEVLNMECRPFNIQVMNVAPGSIRSNISKNQTVRFSLPTDSLYSKYLPNIMTRINASQQNPTPSEDFARLVVKNALKKSPPLHLTGGGNWLLFEVFRWLPRTFVLWFMWRLYSKKM